MSEENKVLARRFCDGLNIALDGRSPTALAEQDAAAVFDEIMTRELAQQTKQETVPGARSAWGDHHVEIVDMIAEGDQVWARVTTSGGHTGEYRGVSSTGKRWTNTGVLFIRVVDGKMTEWSGVFDELNLLMQLGATFTPPQS